MVEIVLIRLAPPKLHIRNLEITPEMARAIPIRIRIMQRPPRLIRHPIQRIIPMQILRVLREEFLRFGPQRGDGFGVVVEVDGEAVGLVVVVHVPEDVVVDVAEEMDLGLHAPVVAGVGQRGVFVEHAAVPAAHLVVGDEVGVLDALLFEHDGGFFEEGEVDPGGDVPVFFGD